LLVQEGQLERMDALKARVVIRGFFTEQQQAVSLDEEKIVFPPNI